MALDYRTPRRRKPICTDKPFARFGEWTVQHFRRGKWLVIARRINQSAAVEWALGWEQGCWRERSANAPTESVWVVGPDGFGYFCYGVPAPRSRKRA